MIGPISENLAYIGQTTLAITLLIGLVLLVRRPFAKHFGAKAAYALWAIPAIRLVLPPLPEGWSLFSPLGKAVASAAEPMVAEVPSVAMMSSGSGVIITPVPPAAEVLPAIPPSALTLPSYTAVSSGGMVEVLSSVSIGVALLSLWAIGAAGYLIWSAYRQGVFARIVRAEGSIASPAVLTEAMEICQSIGLDHRRILVRTSFISDSPFVTGLFRSIVVLPAWFEMDYSAEEREVALMHELMHVKRRDLWALQASTLFLALQWFNPVAHYAMRAFRSDQEASCDADVLGIGCSTPHAYGATLVKAVRKSRPAAAPMMAASLPLTHSLTERLKQLRNPLPTLRRRLMGSSLIATLGSAALIASACTTASAHPHDQSDTLEGGPLAELEDRETAKVKNKKRYMFTHNNRGNNFFLLDNPMDDVEFEIDAVEDLSEVVATEAADLEILIQENIASIADDVALAMVDVAEDLKLQIEDGKFSLDLNERDIQATGDIMAFVGEIMARTAAGDISETEIDAMTDEFEDRIDAWTDNIEARVEAMEPIIEARVEAYTDHWNDEIEARIDAHSDMIERHSDAIEAHADKIEEAGDLIGDLADDCSDERGLRVVSRINSSTGKRYKAICFDAAGGMTKDEIMQRLRESGELTNAELDKFCDGFDRNASFSLEWTFDED
ncbi:MAG: M56 family metallopeptidase [Pseudomonadota bacterium]